MTTIRLDSMQSAGRSLLAEQVAERIDQYIVEHNLTPGDKLPNEFELCEQLGVGRGTIREAEKILVARNVLSVQRGRGTFVAERTGEIDDPFGLAYRHDQIALAADMVELRMQLEPWFAEMASKRAEPEDLERLLAQCRRLVEIKDRLLPQFKLLTQENSPSLETRGVEIGRAFLEGDKEFHRCIAECTHNAIIPKLIPIINYSVVFSGTLFAEDRMEETVIQHQRIADAICAGDPDNARKAMQEHLEFNRFRVERMKERQESGSIEGLDGDILVKI